MLPNEAGSQYIPVHHCDRKKKKKAKIEMSWACEEETQNPDSRRENRENWECQCSFQPSLKARAVSFI